MYLQIVASQQAYKINLSIFIPISLLPFTAKLFQFFYTHWGTLLHFLSWHHFNQDFTNTSLQNILWSTIKQQPLGHQIQCSTLSLNITFLALLHFFWLSGPIFIPLLLCHCGVLSLPFARSSSSPQPLNIEVPRLSLLILFLFIYT